MTKLARHCRRRQAAIEASHRPRSLQPKRQERVGAATYTADTPEATRLGKIAILELMGYSAADIATIVPAEST